MELVKAREELDSINGLEDPTPQDLSRRSELMKIIERLEFEQEQRQKHEERVKQSVSLIADSLDSVEIEGLPIRSLFAGEEQYQLVSIWFKKLMEEQADGFSQQIQSEQLENKQLREEIKEQNVIISELKDELYQAKLERDQANQYRDNAIMQLEDERQEVSRLNEQVDELQKQLAEGAKNAFKVTNLNGAKELAEKIKASLTPVVAIEQINGTTIRVTHLDGTTEETNWLDKGKYRLVDEEEAARFRQEEAKRLETNPVSDCALDELKIEPPTFQIPETAIDGLAQGDACVEVAERADQEVAKGTLEERLAALEAWKKTVDEILGTEEKGVA